MDFDEDEDQESIARTSGISPAARRLQLGLSAIVGRPDGAVVEMFPDGTEVVLDPPGQSSSDQDPDVADEKGGRGT